jgi:hypothetical protein
LRGERKGINFEGKREKERKREKKREIKREKKERKKRNKKQLAKNPLIGNRYLRHFYKCFYEYF